MQHQPLHVIHTLDTNDLLDEHAMFMYYVDLHGADRVRGAQFASHELSDKVVKVDERKAVPFQSIYAFSES